MQNTQCLYPGDDCDGCRYETVCAVAHKQDSKGKRTWIKVRDVLMVPVMIVLLPYALYQNYKDNRRGR